MRNEFFEHAYSAFSSLIDKYCDRITTEQYLKSNFGNSLIRLETDNFRIKCTKDRLQILIWISSLVEPDNWYDPEKVLEVIGYPVPHSKTHLESLQILDEAATLIEKYYDKLTTALSKENYPSTKAKLEGIHRHACHCDEHLNKKRINLNETNNS